MRAFPRDGAGVELLEGTVTEARPTPAKSCTGTDASFSSAVEALDSPGAKSSRAAAGGGASPRKARAVKANPYAVQRKTGVGPTRVDDEVGADGLVVGQGVAAFQSKKFGARWASLAAVAAADARGDGSAAGEPDDDTTVPPPAHLVKLLSTMSSANGSADGGVFVEHEVDTKTRLIEQAYATMRRATDLVTLGATASLVIAMALNELLESRRPWTDELRAHGQRGWPALVAKSLMWAISLATVVGPLRWYYQTKLDVSFLTARRNDQPRRRAHVLGDHETRGRFALDCVKLLVQCVPLVNPTFRFDGGLHSGDPKVEYTLDAMLIVVMIVLRLPTFFRRSFYAHQYLFSNEARVLALLTNTEVNANMAMRAYLNAHASVVMAVVPLAYLAIIAYLHVLVERPTDGWRTGALYDDDDLADRVTWANAWWLHFVTSTTVGYGVYVVRTHVGRVLAVVSVMFGLVMSSYIVNAVFETLNMSRGERYILEKLELKAVRAEMVISATLLIQRSMRVKAWRRRNEADTRGSPERRREIRRELAGQQGAARLRRDGEAAHSRAFSDRRLSVWERCRMQGRLAAAHARFERARAKWRRTQRKIKRMQQRDFELESMMEKILGHTSNLAATKFETRFEEMEERVAAVETQLSGRLDTVDENVTAMRCQLDVLCKAMLGKP